LRLYGVRLNKVDKYDDGTIAPTHGMSRTRQYNTWHGMVNRCTLKTHKAYYRYGGRGITICDKWKTFDGFWEDMQEGYADNLQIDRIDNDKGYYKENCCWSTPKEQNRNTSRTVVIETPRGPMVFSEACEVFGIPDSTLWNRVYRRKWPKEQWFIGYPKNGT
jgi:hypothetical protein